MTIQQAIEDYKAIGINLVRDAKTYSFGTPERCEEGLKACMCEIDSSITTQNYKFLPEYKEIVEWMSNTHGKGLFLAGSCGRGKTNIIMSVLPLMFKLRYNIYIHPYSSIDAIHIDDIEKERAYCIDDIGREPTQNIYGQKRELIMDLLEYAERDYRPVFMSTNLTGQELIERYDQRTLDRIARLCKIVKFNGESLRSNNDESILTF